MSKPLTLIGKVKLFIRYLKDEKDGVSITCGLCNSTDIKFHNQNEHEVGEDIVVYESDYECNNCGGECQNRQVWRRKVWRKN